MELSELVRVLPDWYRANGRALPWRADREPYHVWLSEVMLQQTRGAAVWGYYTRFLAALPDIPALAACPEDRLMKLWEGLGYYSRARNLQKAARIITEDCGGRFPRDWAAIRALPGIGDYTAGAVASICFGLPTPAVDGNVLRVVCRYTACPDDVLQPRTRRAVTQALADVYPEEGSGVFTQALMELGETVCLPRGEPDCARCPLGSTCASREARLWQTIPLRGTRKPRRQQTVTVLLLNCAGDWALRKRPGTGLLAGLWEFPCLEGELTEQQALDAAAALGCRPEALLRSVARQHSFTHVEWTMRGYVISCRARGDGLVWADPARIDGEFSLPTAFRQFRPALDA